MEFEERDAKIGPQVQPPEKSETSSKAERNFHLDQAYCVQRAQILFGSYRRDDAANPETYAVSISMVLSEYPRAVVDLVTDPRTGIASRQNFLPTVFEVKDACEAEMKRIATMSKPLVKNRVYPYIPVSKEPGCFANKFVASDQPIYPAIEKYIHGKGVDPREWKRGKSPSREINGIWISYTVYIRIRGGGRLGLSFR